MESATITKVTLRKEKLRSGKLSLYLDYYPPIWNPHTKKMSRREFLGLYLISNPRMYIRQKIVTLPKMQALFEKANLRNTMKSASWQIVIR